MFCAKIRLIAHNTTPEHKIICLIAYFCIKQHYDGMILARLNALYRDDQRLAGRFRYPESVV